MADAVESGDVGVGVAPRPTGRRPRRRQQPELLVVAQRPRGHAGLGRGFTDPQSRRGVGLGGGIRAHAGIDSATAGSSSRFVAAARSGSVSSTTAGLPRSAEQAAPTRHIASDMVKAIRRPCMNGLEMRCGKKLRPVTLACAAGDSVLSLVPSSVFIGLYPRNAAKSSATGGRWEMAVADRWSSPCPTSPALRVWGRVDARPTIIMLKNSPMDSTMPELRNVALMPDAAPRSRLGTEFMMPVVLGAANSPKAPPLINSRRANTGYMKLAGRNSSSRKLRPPTNMPPVAKMRAPYLSER